MRSKREFERENERLRKICTDLHWMARRYADGRMTYVTGMFNEITRQMLEMGIQLNVASCDETIWARDGMGRAYDGLTEEEASK